MIFAKPYKLIPKIQNYAWGTKNEKAFIPKLLGFKAEPNIPYAELWIGAHPKNSSEIIIENSQFPLIEIIEKFPKEILGEKISKKFNKKLPFLLKILSIGKALSIQAHPNKNTAKYLNKIDPINYPDENHKPEIAIAIDKLNAIVGLKNIHMIKKRFEEFPILFELLNENLKKKILLNNFTKNVEKEIYKLIMNSQNSVLENVIDVLVKDINSKKKKSKIEKQFLGEFKNYGIDVGLISLLLFNFIELNSNQAIFTPAGIPHAYLGGNIVECMANSDNVVRAGLTNKFKDVKTLLKIIETDLSKTKVKVLNKKNITYYKTFAEEFDVKKVILNSDFNTFSSKNYLPEIHLVMKGKVKIYYGSKISIFKKGETFLKPAILNSYSISTIHKNSEIFIASVKS
ncbi:MAG: mannose-6-phosphate isomerase, class I [Ignavibacteriae bacterium]|nr:mannose-6-phosphate isomerase, class I [Ignavibacteriota bacterium]